MTKAKGAAVLAVGFVLFVGTFVHADSFEQMTTQVIDNSSTIKQMQQQIAALQAQVASCKTAAAAPVQSTYSQAAVPSADLTSRVNALEIRMNSVESAINSIQTSVMSTLQMVITMLTHK